MNCMLLPILVVVSIILIKTDGFSISNKFSRFSRSVRPSTYITSNQIKKLHAGTYPDDIDPLLEFDNSKTPDWDPLGVNFKSMTPAEGAVALSLISRIEKLFTMIEAQSTTKGGISSIRVTKDLLRDWEANANAIAADIRSVSDSQEIALIAYRKLIGMAAPLTLDPLHLSTFDIISRAVIDTVSKFYPKGTPITDLVQIFTDIHLEFIEPFRKVIDDGGSDGYSQSSKQEFLCYQYAAMIKLTYEYISKSLGSDYDTTPQVQTLRLASWASPVFARMQRRFVRFSSSFVDEKTDEIYQNAFERLLLSVSLDISPKYVLSSVSVPENNEPFIPSEQSNEVDTSLIYPSWDQSDAIIKLLRKTVVGFDILRLELESKLMRTAQNEISTRMRPLGKLLENSFKTLSSQKTLQPNELKAVENMLNIGHSVIAATYSIWHIIYNIVGIPDEEGVYVKEFLTPVSLTNKDMALESIPQSIRFSVDSDVKDLSAQLQPSNYLQAISVLAFAIRSTASEFFRALILYDADQSEWPTNRDAGFKTVLTLLLYDALSVKNLNEKVLYQNLIAIAALEEAMAVREPRVACKESLELAIVNVIMKLLKQETLPSGEELYARISLIEKALCMTLRMPPDNGYSLRYDAFTTIIESILQNSNEDTAKALKEVERVNSWISLALNLDNDLMREFVEPLLLGKFDKAVGSIMLNSDILSGMPQSIGETMLNQLYEISEQISLSKEESNARISYLSGAVFLTFMQTALEEFRLQNYERVEALLKKGYNLFRHPMLLLLEQQGSVKRSLRDIGIQVLLARFGNNLTVEFIRLLENMRQRLSSESSTPSSGWGSSSYTVGKQKADPEFLAYLTKLQQDILKEYTTASIKRGF